MKAPDERELTGNLLYKPFMGREIKRSDMEEKYHPTDGTCLISKHEALERQTST